MLCLVDSARISTRRNHFLASPKQASTNTRKLLPIWEIWNNEESWICMRHFCFSEKKRQFFQNTLEAGIIDGFLNFKSQTSCPDVRNTCVKFQPEILSFTIVVQNKIRVHWGDPPCIMGLVVFLYCCIHVGVVLSALPVQTQHLDIINMKWDVCDYCRFTHWALVDEKWTHGVVFRKALCVLSESVCWFDELILCCKCSNTTLRHGRHTSTISMQETAASRFTPWSLVDGKITQGCQSSAHLFYIDIRAEEHC